jgi:AraC-like DNA-binding protein
MESPMEPPATQRRGNGPARLRLSLSVARGNAREFELWRWGHAPIYAMDAPHARARASFSSRMTGYIFGDIAIASDRSSAAVFERTGQTIARSGIDNVSLVVYSDGGCDLDIEGRAAELHAGDVCVLDMTRRSALRVTDHKNLSIVLPRALLAPYVADLDGLHGRILRRGAPLNAMLVRHLQTLFAEAPALGLSDARAAAGATAALVAAFVGPSPDGRDAIARTAAAASLQAARRTIEANLHDPGLGPEFVGRQLGMSRAKLYRLFEPIGGVGQYIQQRRMARAYQAITDPAQTRERVGEIAARCGFSNASVFSRAFRQAYGVSPTELRSAVGRAGTADIGLSGDSGFHTMRRWLLGIGAANG